MLEHLNKHILSEHPTQIEQTAAYRKKFDKIIEAEEEYHDYIKGQLISECLFDFFLNFPKNQRKSWQISVPESKKWSNHKIKAL